ATVTIEKPGGSAVQASSMLMLMTLGAGQGDEVTLRAEDEGAEESVNALADLLEKDLDAEESAGLAPTANEQPHPCSGRRHSPGSRGIGSSTRTALSASSALRAATAFAASALA